MNGGQTPERELAEEGKAATGSVAQLGRRALFKVAMLTLSLAVSLLLAEVVLRVAMPANKAFRIWPPSTYHVFRPDPAVVPGHSPENRFTVNALGLRGPEPGGDDEVRILAIGGSTTECLLIDDARAWPLAVAQRIGKTHDGRPVWSASAGLSGMNSRDHVLHAKYLLPELPRIDVVVAMMGVNDVSAALGMPAKYGPMPVDLPADQQEAALRRAFHVVPGRLEHSWDYEAGPLRGLALVQLAVKVKRARSRDLASRHLANDVEGKVVQAWRQRRQRASRFLDQLPDLAPALAAYRENLRSFTRLLRERSIRVVLVTQPTLWRADLTPDEQQLLWMGGEGDFLKEDGVPYFAPGALAEAMRRFNETMLATCVEEGVECVDLASQIPRDTSIFYDDCHFGDRGSELIADRMSAALVRGAPFAP